MTPFHMAMLASAFANANGDIMTPRIAENMPISVYSEGFSKNVAARVRKAMRYVVTNGTGKGANLAGLDVCGKTGTAQNPGGDDHSWFICFNNSGKQRLAIAVIVENAGFGSSAALPVAVGILQAANASDPEAPAHNMIGGAQ
jgi:peptidoglycan glycosyltransferase